MKKAVFFLALMLLGSSYLKAQPYLTINNNSSCTLEVLANAFDPNNCTTNVIHYINSSFPSMSSTVVDAATLCGCTPTGYIWATGRVDCPNTTFSGGTPCNNNIVTIGDGTTCGNPGPSSKCMSVDLSCGNCGSVTVTITPGANGNATVDIN